MGESFQFKCLLLLLLSHLPGQGQWWVGGDSGKTVLLLSLSMCLLCISKTHHCHYYSCLLCACVPLPVVLQSPTPLPYACVCLFPCLFLLLIKTSLLFYLLWAGKGRRREEALDRTGQFRFCILVSFGVFGRFSSTPTPFLACLPLPAFHACLPPYLSCQPCHLPSISPSLPSRHFPSLLCSRTFCL